MKAENINALWGWSAPGVLSFLNIRSFVPTINILGDSQINMPFLTEIASGHKWFTSGA